MINKIHFRPKSKLIHSNLFILSSSSLDMTQIKTYQCSRESVYSASWLMTYNLILLKWKKIVQRWLNCVNSARHSKKMVNQTARILSEWLHCRLKWMEFNGSQLPLMTPFGASVGYSNDSAASNGLPTDNDTKEEEKRHRKTNCLKLSFPENLEIMLIVARLYVIKAVFSCRLTICFHFAFAFSFSLLFCSITRRTQTRQNFM